MAIVTSTSSYTFASTDKIQEGVAAKVYRGKDNRSGSPVAFKEYCCRCITTPAEVSFLQQLIGTAHIIQMRDFFQVDQRSILALDLLYSSNKKEVCHVDLVELFPKLSLKEIITCGKQLLECLLELKRRGIVHSDIKPENAIFNKDLRILRLFDFGNAVKCADQKNHGGRTIPLYQPPEAFLGRSQVDMDYDMWSFGVTFFSIYTNEELFFEGKELCSILSTFGKPSEAYLQGCSNKSVDHLIDKKWAKDWKAVIRKAATKWGRSERHAKRVIDLLERIFRYENRLTVEEALAHPLFKNDVHIALDCGDMPRLKQKQTFLEVQGLKIPLTERCIHLQRMVNDKYDLFLTDTTGKVLQAFRETLHSGSVLSIGNYIARE
jgi:serine/threonine protein kinase